MSSARNAACVGVHYEAIAVQGYRTVVRRGHMVNWAKLFHIVAVSFLSTRGFTNFSKNFHVQFPSSVVS